MVSSTVMLLRQPASAFLRLRRRHELRSFSSFQPLVNNWYLIPMSYQSARSERSQTIKLPNTSKIKALSGLVFYKSNKLLKISYTYFSCTFVKKICLEIPFLPKTCRFFLLSAPMGRVSWSKPTSSTPVLVSPPRDNQTQAVFLL